MSKWLVIAGIVFGLVAVVLLNWHIGSIEASQKSVALLRLKPTVALTKGERINLDMVQTEQVPERFSSLTKLAIADSPESRTWIENRPVTSDVSAGSVLLHEHFTDDPAERFAARISKGMRAVAIPVTSAGAVNYFIEPGSRVDILGTFENTGQDEVELPIRGGPAGSKSTLSVPSFKRTTVTKTVLQDVHVLAVGRAVTRGNYVELGRDGFSTVTVELSPADAEKLTFAMSQMRGGICLTLRSPEDQAVEAMPNVSWDSLN